MRKITLLILIIPLFVFSAFAQKAKVVNIRLKAGDQKGEYLGDSKATGTTVFVVKIHKGQCFEATAKIETNNSKMAGEYYTKNLDGSIDDNTVTQGSGVFSNQFDGCESERDQNFYFKITEKPSAKFSFRTLVKNREDKLNAKIYFNYNLFNVFFFVLKLFINGFRAAERIKCQRFLLQTR